MIIEAAQFQEHFRGPNFDRLTVPRVGVQISNSCFHVWLAVFGESVGCHIVRLQHGHGQRLSYPSFYSKTFVHNLTAWIATLCGTYSR